MYLTSCNSLFQEPDYVFVQPVVPNVLNSLQSIPGSERHSRSGPLSEKSHAPRVANLRPQQAQIRAKRESTRDSPYSQCPAQLPARDPCSHTRPTERSREDLPSRQPYRQSPSVHFPLQKIIRQTGSRRKLHH